MNDEALKPKVLYHASANRGIAVLEPRAETVRDEKEGSVVFATPGKAEASRFIVPSDDSWTRKMSFGEVPVHVISDRDRYMTADRGGTIYSLNPATFETDATKGAGKKEWTSRVPVVPIGREDYTSGLQAQLDNGVQVFFVDKETFGQITSSADHGNFIIRGLVSENLSRNLNVKEIPSISVPSQV